MVVIYINFTCIYTVLFKTFRPPVFWLLHKTSYLTQYRTNYSDISTYNRAKRYLQLVA